VLAPLLPAELSPIGRQSAQKKLLTAKNIQKNRHFGKKYSKKMSVSREFPASRQVRQAVFSPEKIARLPRNRSGVPRKKKTKTCRFAAKIGGLFCGFATKFI